MSNIDFIDLFDDDNQGMNAGYTDSYEESLSPLEIGNQEKMTGAQRMKINDYKHSSHTLQKTAPQKQAQAAAPAPKAKSIKLDDEKIVWAGAIFVFFGVFVFLIGYWLGKATLKTVSNSNQQYLAGIQEKLENEQLQNSMTMPLSQDGGKVDSITPEVSPEHSPTVSTPQPKNDIEPIIAPPIKDPDLKKPETKATVKQPAPVVKAEPKSDSVKSTPAPKSSNVKGDYTLQVSAHTNLEKARSIETEMRNQGHQAYIVESMVNGVRYFRVRVGKFDSKDEADSALAKIRKTSVGKDSYLIKLN